MKAFKNYIFLTLALTMLFACQSPASQIRETRESACHSSFASVNHTLRIPPEVMRGPLTSRFNHLVTHAQDLSRCLACESCVRKWTEWERNCQNQRVAILEGSYFPGAFLPRAECSIPAPVCALCGDNE